MDNQQLEMIAKMLRAQLMGAGHLWWVSGWVYGETKNKGDLFIILYPSAESLKEKVVRVYPHDFKKLPSFIPTDVDGGDTEANPSKEQARKRGIYHECPPFEIVTYDGRDTQMGKERRFGDVLRLSSAAREALGQAGRAAPPPPAANVGAQTRPPAQQSAAPPPQPEPPAEEFMELPDFRGLALEATTEAAFDYAAFMTLRNGLYTEQEHIGKARQSLVPAWKPSPASNRAMLAALETYRDKRLAAEGRGEAPGEAHKFAKREAMRVYNQEIGK